MSRRITAGNWIIPTVRKHIVPEEALAGAGVAVCVEESSEGRIVISALQVIEARLRIVVVPAVTQLIRGRRRASTLYRRVSGQKGLHGSKFF